MNGGPSHVDTFDPKPLLDEVPRQAAAEPEPPHRAQDRRGDAARRSSSASTARAASRSASCSPRRPAAHRRHVRHPLDARRRAQPRAVADADELRRRPAAAAEHGLVGHLRPGHREPEPARLHRDVPRRLSDRGDAELAVGVPARRLPGHLHRHPAHRRRQADREHPQRRDAARPSSGGSSTWCGGSTSGTCEPRPHDPQLEARIQSFELAYRMQAEAADAFDISREPRVDPRRCTGRARRPGSC